METIAPIKLSLEKPMIKSKVNFVHSPQLFILDSIRTRSFIELPERSHIDIAMTYHVRNDIYILSYSGKIYHCVSESAKNFNTSFSNLICWETRYDGEHLEIIPFGPATFDHDYLMKLIENYYNNYYCYMKISANFDCPSSMPFSLKQREHLGVSVPIRVA